MATLKLGAFLSIPISTGVSPTPKFCDLLIFGDFLFHFIKGEVLGSKIQ